MGGNMTGCYGTISEIEEECRMRKRIIIDVDNTLIEWKEEYNQMIDKALEEFGFPVNKEIRMEIQKAFEEYEIDHYTFNKNEMTKFINGISTQEYPKECIERIIELWGECAPEEIDEEVKDALMYLSKKYELVVLTDWFVLEQKRRLEKAGILPFFTHLYGAEKTKRKPFPEAFKQAMGENKPEECVIIGDDWERDIKGAMGVGIQAIWLTKEKTKENIDGVTQMMSWGEIKEIL